MDYCILLLHLLNYIYYEIISWNIQFTQMYPILLQYTDFQKHFYSKASMFDIPIISVENIKLLVEKLSDKKRRRYFNQFLFNIYIYIYIKYL